MNIGIHPTQEPHLKQPRDHGRLYELFHDARFWAVVITILLILGTFATARAFKNKVQRSFKYQPTYSP